VNCCARIIECNTLGKIPFKDTMQRESWSTHARVAQRFTIRQMGDAWVVATFATQQQTKRKRAGTTANS